MNNPVQSKEYDKNVFNVSNLNEKQRLAFTILTNWVTAKVDSLSNNEENPVEPILMHIQVC